MDNEEIGIQNKSESLHVIKTELTRMPHTHVDYTEVKM